MNEYDKRQFNLMLIKIKSFNDGHLYLPDLINDLEALLNVLTIHDQTWSDTFHSYWRNLEIVYACALAEEKTHLDSNDQQIITEAIANLNTLIKCKLKDCHEYNDQLPL